jgi:hypothetical protein
MGERARRLRRKPAHVPVVVDPTNVPSCHFLVGGTNAKSSLRILMKGFAFDGSKLGVALVKVSRTRLKNLSDVASGLRGGPSR